MRAFIAAKPAVNVGAHERMDTDDEVEGFKQSALDGDLSGAQERAANNIVTGTLELLARKTAIFCEYEIIGKEFVCQGRTLEGLISNDKPPIDPVYKEQLLAIQRNFVVDSACQQGWLASPDLGFGRHYLYSVQRIDGKIQMLAIEFVGDFKDFDKFVEKVTGSNDKVIGESGETLFKAVLDKDAKPFSQARIVEVAQQVLSADSLSAEQADYLNRISRDFKNLELTKRHQADLVDRELERLKQVSFDISSIDQSLQFIRARCDHEINASLPRSAIEFSNHKTHSSELNSLLIGSNLPSCLDFEPGLNMPETSDSLNSLDVDRVQRQAELIEVDLNSQILAPNLNTNGFPSLTHDSGGDKRNYLLNIGSQVGASGRSKMEHIETKHDQVAQVESNYKRGKESFTADCRTIGPKSQKVDSKKPELQRAYLRLPRQVNRANSDRINAEVAPNKYSLLWRHATTRAKVDNLHPKPRPSATLKLVDQNIVTLKFSRTQSTKALGPNLFKTPISKRIQIRLKNVFGKLVGSGKRDLIKKFDDKMLSVAVSVRKVTRIISFSRVRELIAGKNLIGLNQLAKLKLRKLFEVASLVRMVRDVRRGRLGRNTMARFRKHTRVQLTRVSVKVLAFRVKSKMYLKGLFRVDGGNRTEATMKVGVRERTHKAILRVKKRLQEVLQRLIIYFKKRLITHPNLRLSRVNRDIRFLRFRLKRPLVDRVIALPWMQARTRLAYRALWFVRIRRGKLNYSFLVKGRGSANSKKSKRAIRKLMAKIRELRVEELEIFIRTVKKRSRFHPIELDELRFLMLELEVQNEDLEQELPNPLSFENEQSDQFALEQ